MSKFRKILAGFSAVAISVALMPMFAAFEAHVINVTAKIENALSVPTEALNFGTVFPQEQLAKFLNISLSQSFKDEPQADDVNYIIRQKPKCGVTSENGTILVGSTWTGHIVVNTDGSTTIDCNKDKPAGVGDGQYLLPSLCEYVSKHPDGKDDDTDSSTVIGQTNDGSLNSFHKPFEVLPGTGTTTPPAANYYIDWNDTPGRLAKSENDTTDNWTIDLKVPCFGNYCAQDWASFVTGINPNAIPADYTQDITNEHKIFGCNLWVEVTGVSRIPTQCNDNQDNDRDGLADELDPGCMLNNVYNPLDNDESDL
ncbi:MAG: hypothetical protein AAB706_01130 [Patescibacteria group bacterium]